MDFPVTSGERETPGRYADIGISSGAGNGNSAGTRRASFSASSNSTYTCRVEIFSTSAAASSSRWRTVRWPSCVRSSMPAAIVSISAKPKASAALEIFCAMRWRCAMAAGSSGKGASGRQALIWATSACVRVRKRSVRACCDICDVLVSPVSDTATLLGASSLAWLGRMPAFSSRNLSAASHSPVARPN